ncbi:MAG: hypothetical protein MUP58_03595 [Candidatus Nanohaloarchaeota archaeon QJJ-9]|nr:hypothetical protein [Candidatus Nanohaloarchaeota archaeon QJJ-9]
MKKGFVYTLFALFYIGLLIFTIQAPLSIQGLEEADGSTGVNEFFYYMRSLEDDMQRSSKISSRRALIATTDFLIDKGEPLEESESIIKHAFVNGSVNNSTSSIMEDSSLRDWKDTIIRLSEEEGYKLSMDFNLDGTIITSSDNFKVGFRTPYSFYLADTSLETSFNKSGETLVLNESVVGLNDPLILLETGGKRSNTIERCRNPPAVEAGQGSEYEYNLSGRDWVSGDSVVTSDPSSVSEKGSKVLFVEDLCGYSYSTLDSFAGVVSEATTSGKDVCGSGEEINAYIGGYPNVSEFLNGTRVVMDQSTVWRNFIPSHIDSGCYFFDSNAPCFLSRLEGELVGEDGFSTFLDVPYLPPEYQLSNRTAIDYLYFNDSVSYHLEKVKGVSDYMEWFRLDEKHLDYWNISSLGY